MGQTVWVAKLGIYGCITSHKYRSVLTDARWSFVAITVFSSQGLRMMMVYQIKPEDNPKTQQ